MAFITAETRSDLIELSVAMLKQAPSAALLEELIALSVGGGSLADAADHIAKTAAFKAEYPSFQTAEQYAAEIFDNITTGGTVTADIRTAVIELATGMLTSGSVTKAGLALAIAEYLAAPAALLNTDFADIAQSFQNRADAAEYFVVTKELGGSTAAELAAAIASVTSDAATLTAANTAADATASAEAVVAGQTFTLTTGIDSGTSFTGGTAADTFVATAATAATQTINAGDSITGGDGEDQLNLTVSITGGATVGTGVASSSIETLSVNAVTATTLDSTLMAGVTDITNNGSLADLTISGLGSIPTVNLTATSANTVLGYASAATTVGGADEQAINLNGAATTGALTLTTDGIETLNVDASGTASGAATRLITLDSDSLKNVTITGDATSALAINLVGATATAAGTVTGNDVANTVSLTADAADDITVDLGDGNDVLITTNFGAEHTLTGGDGIDVISTTQAAASAVATGATLSGWEALNILDGGTGTIDMDDFAGIASVIYDAGLAAATTVDNAVTGTSVEVDVTATAQNLTIDLETDGTADALTVVLDAIGTGDNIGTINASDAETLTITADDDTADATGDVTIASITLGDATKVVFSGDAATTVSAATNPTTAVLAALDASGMTNDLTVSGMNFAAAGATITLGSGDDTLTFATAAGSDAIDLTNGGKDVIAYTALAQSDAADMDVITGFESGSDDIDFTGLALADGSFVTTSSLFGGVGSTKTAAEGLLGGTAGARVVFQADESILWVDLDQNGTLTATDFRVQLSGVDEIAATDLNLTGAGATIAATAASAVLSTALSTNMSKVATNESDTITSSSAFAVGSTFDGGQGTDSISFSLTAGTTTVDLDDAAGDIENIESVTIATGILQLNLLAADVAGNTGGEIATITGSSATGQTLLIDAGSVDLTDVTNTNFETISANDSAGAGITLTIDVANLTDVDRLVLDDTNQGNVDTLSLAGGTYDFSAIDLDFDDAGVANVITMDVDDALGGSITLDDADVDNVGVITGEATAAVITTIATVGDLDLSAMAVTEIDTFTVGGTDSTLTIDGDDYTAMAAADTPVVTITGSGDDNLTFVVGGGAAALNLTDAIISGFDTIDVAAAATTNTLTLDSSSISGEATLVGNATGTITIAEDGDYSNIALTAADFTDLLLTATTVTAVTVDEGMFAGAIDLIDGTAAGDDPTLTVAMSTTTLDLGAVLLGTTHGVDLVVTGTTGNDTITAVDASAIGSSVTLTGNGGSDSFRLEDGSGNGITAGADLMVIANAVSITDFNTANDLILLDSAFSSGANAVVGVASGASNVDTAAVSYITDAVMSDFSSLTQLATAVGAITAGTAGDDHYYAISNLDGSQVAIYGVTQATAVLGALTTIDADDNVSLIAVIDVTGTFSASDLTLY